MKLLTTHEIHATEVDGKFYNSNGVIEYNALCNYRFAIRNLLLVSRCKKGSKAKSDWLRIDGEGIDICPIPDFNFHSPLKVLFLLPSIFKKSLKAIKSCDRYMVRLPGPTGAITAILLQIKKKQYAIELVGDPIGMFKESKGFIKHQWFYTLFNSHLYKYLVKKAYCVGYRSEFLRKKYPCQHPEQQWVFSGAQLSDGAIAAPRKIEWFKKEPFVIMFVGRINKEKGVIHLLHAFKKMLETSQKKMELHYIGDGAFLPQLKHEANRLGLNNSVIFHGRVERGTRLFALLDQAHCFVLPTYLEGMPRSLIEAMARGVPCFASNIEVVTEVLDPTYCFAPRDFNAIVKTLLPVVNNPARLAEISFQCFEASKAHWPEALATAKKGFWNDVIHGCK